MPTSRVALAAGAVAAGALAVGYGLGTTAGDEPASSSPPAAVAADPGTVTGPCGEVALPPDSPACAAVAGLIRYGFWPNFVNAKTTKAWRRDNPGEWARLSAFLAVPAKVSPVSMLTPLGGALVTLVQAYAYTHGEAFPPPDVDPRVKAGIGSPVIQPPPSSPSP